MAVDTNRALKRIATHFSRKGQPISVETKIVSLRMNHVGKPDSVYEWHVWVDDPNRRAVLRQLSHSLDKSSVAGLLTDAMHKSFDDNGIVALRNAGEAIKFLEGEAA